MIWNVYRENANAKKIEIYNIFDSFGNFPYTYTYTHFLIIREIKNFDCNIVI